MTAPEDVLDLLGLGTEYSPEAVDKVDAELKKMEPKLLAAKAKQAEVREERLVLTGEWDSLCAARALLCSNRTPQEGDVNISVPPIGSSKGQKA